MSNDVEQLYESLFTFEQMLTESIAQCAEVFELAERAGLSHVSQKLKRGIITQLSTFLDGNTEHSMPSIVESIEGDPQSEQLQEEHQDLQYSNSGNPKYDEMFNKLLESSVEIEQTGRTKFKLDEINRPSEHELEHPIASLPPANNPPRLPSQKEKVEFDGMENWRSLMNEGSSRGGGSAPAGDAGDIARTIMNLSENDVEGLMPSSNPPRQSNPNMDVDSDVGNILANL